MSDKQSIRVQFENFNKSHFDIAPIWEFAIDEEGEDGQDETTLKPRLDLSSPDPSEGSLIIECEFVSKSGKRFSGVCTPWFDNSLSNIQPYIVINGDWVTFWFGVAQPDINTKKKMYDLIGETSDSLFPVKFNSVLPMKDGIQLKGQIEGFMWLKLSDGSIVIEK